MSPSHSYLFLNLCVLAFLFSFWQTRIPVAEMRRYRLLPVTIAFLAIWTLVDVLAVQLSLWYFPIGGTLPWRLFALPMEEYLVFVVHTLLAFTLLIILME